MCTFNGEAYVAEQLDSILKQSWHDFEVVVFDDNSDDCTPDILATYARRDSRIRVFRNPSRIGFAENFTRALTKCRGDLISPADQDDIWLPQKLSKLAENISDAALIYCDSEYIDASGEPLGVRMSSLRRMYRGSNPLAFAFTNCISGHALLVKREFLKKYMPVPEGMYYDWWLAIAAAASDAIKYCDEPLVLFRRHERTVTSLGGVRGGEKQTHQEFLQGRLRILGAIASLPGPNQQNAVKMHGALKDWLAGGSPVAFLLMVLRHARPLFWIISKRPTAFVSALRLQYLT